MRSIKLMNRVIFSKVIPHCRMMCNVPPPLSSKKSHIEDTHLNDNQKSDDIVDSPESLKSDIENIRENLKILFENDRIIEKNNNRDFWILWFGLFLVGMACSSRY